MYCMELKKHIHEMYPEHIIPRKRGKMSGSQTDFGIIQPKLKWEG